MVLSSPNKIFDPIRGVYLIETPEEKVRQSFLQRLMESGYPKELIRLEVEIKDVARIKKAPKRRADIVCFAKTSSDIVPFLLVECKAVKIREKTKAQVLGYNYYIGAQHLCVVNQEELFFGITDKNGQYQFHNRFYNFDELIALG